MAFWTYRCADAKPEVYGKFIDHWQAMVMKFHDSAACYVVNGHELDMLKRCVAMCAFVHSPAFSGLTAFMDNDAFPNANLSDVPIDAIGLTERRVETFMPINEGVIFAKPSEEAKAFFRAYVGTFEAIANSVQITTELMDGKPWPTRNSRWWGGQIAVNMLRDMPGVTMLPCSEWNYSPEIGSDVASDDLDQRRVLHIKGKHWKRHFEWFKSYQEARP